MSSHFSTVRFEFCSVKRGFLLLARDLFGGVRVLSLNRLFVGFLVELWFSLKVYGVLEFLAQFRTVSSD